MKGESGEIFEECVVLARKFVGVGEWEVWDMQKGADKFCKQCSSEGQRLVYHDKANRCPKVVLKINVGEARGLLAQQAVAERTARIAASSAQSAAEGDDADGEVVVEREEEQPAHEEVVVELAEVQQQGEVIGGKASKKPRVVAASKVVFVHCCFLDFAIIIHPSGISAGRGGGWSRGFCGASEPEGAGSDGASSGGSPSSSPCSRGHT